MSDPDGAVTFHTAIRVTTAEMATWSPERISAFMSGVAQAQAAYHSRERSGGNLGEIAEKLAHEIAAYLVAKVQSGMWTEITVAGMSVARMKDTRPLDFRMAVTMERLASEIETGIHLFHAENPYA